jgi:transcriptional regulator with XRE-family HTH domain
VSIPALVKVSREGNHPPVSNAEGPWEEVAATKRWLRELREQSGMTQAELGARMGLTARAVLNAESAKEGLPRGLPFLKMLRALGVVADAPLQADPLDVRLQALEAEVREAVALTREALELLRAERPQGASAPRSRRQAS